MPKRLTINGVSFDVCGRSGDPYYDHIDNNSSEISGFFGYILNRCLPTGAAVMDIGANIGLTSCIMAVAASHGKVYAFEPAPETFAYLSETMRSNGFSRVEVVQSALGSEPGKLAFARNPVTGSASHLAPIGASLATGDIEVEVQTVDEFCARRDLNRLDFIKIDVEGFERSVLMGAKTTLEKFRPSVFVEFNSFTLTAYGNQYPREFLEYLLENFPHVYCWKNDRPTEIRESHEILSFIHENMVNHGCVDDLLCAWQPLS